MKKIALTLISICFIHTLTANAQVPTQAQLWSGGMPPGSYLQTCSSCSLNSDGTLLCACADRSGVPRNTYLPNARVCRSVENIDGQLTCTQQKPRPFRRHRSHQPVDIPAGPIWNQSNAQQVCPTTCQSNRGTWTGQWRTIVPNQTSVCQCKLY